MLKLTATEEREKVAVVKDIESALPKFFPDSGDTEPATGEEVFKGAYGSLTKDFGTVESDTGYTDFLEAITEITETARKVRPDKRRSVDDVSDLVELFATLPLSETHELRKIFGEMLRLKNEGRSRRIKKQLYASDSDYDYDYDYCAGVVCPDEGFAGVVDDVCEFFACLESDIENRYGTRLEAIFGFLHVDAPLPCLGFVVDTTGSMGQEIKAVQNLVMGFVSSEKDEPACYVINQFNDWHYYKERGITPPGEGKIMKLAIFKN